jgi:hypothetical protein
LEKGLSLSKTWTAPKLGILRARDTAAAFAGPYNDATATTDSLYCFTATGKGADYCYS